MPVRTLKLESADFLMKYGVNLKTRTLHAGVNFITENPEHEVGFPMALNFQTALDVLATEYVPEKGKDSNEEPINIILSTYGGDAYYGLSIFDYIQQLGPPVHIRAFGPCMSAGSIILQAATHRMMSENATMMIHYGWISSGSNVWDPKRMEEEYLHSRRLAERMHKVYLRSFLTKRQLNSFLRIEKYLDAKECLRYGLIDEIIPGLDLG